MNPIEPSHSASLDDIVGPSKPRAFYSDYSPVPEYNAYHWDMPWIRTPESEVRPYDEPEPGPERSLCYEDGLLTPDLFTRAMRELNG